MRLRNKNILLISPEHWNHIFVSKHHYATHLAKRGNQVFFLNPPSDIESVDPTGFDNVFCVNYQGFPKGLRFYPDFLRKYYLRKEFRHLQNLCGVEFQVVWSFDNSVFFDLSFLRKTVLKIVHIVDMNQDFNFSSLAATADICFGVSRPIVERLRRSNERTYHLHHGFAAREYMTKSINISDNKAKGRLKAGYAGNLDLKYIDWPLFDEIISSNNDVTFYFAGPFSEGNSNVEYLKQVPNVVLTGKIDALDIAAFLEEMDILLLFYRVSEFPDQLTNSHKVMEYLGSGRTIVGSWLSDYKEFVGLIEMSERREEIPALFTRVKERLSHFNSQVMIAQRKNFAMNYSYDRQIERVEETIDKELGWSW